MQCPGCHFENEATSTYCERCGTLLQNTTPEPFEDQVPYQVPPPPPMNGHNPPPPLPAFDYSAPLSPEDEQAEAPQISEYSPLSLTSKPLASEQKIHPRHKPGVFSAMLYFLGILIVAFGMFAILVNFGSGPTIGLIGILLSVIIVIAGIVLFVRIMRRRTSSLYWWQRLLMLIGMTIAAFVLLIITSLLFPAKTTADFITSCVFFCYGLVWCSIAIW